MSFAVPVPSAGPSAPPLSNPVVVVNSQFLSSYPVDLVISEKLMTIKEGSFAISDVNGNVMFNVKGSVLSLHDHRVLVDSAGAPIVTFRQKILTAHRRWQVYKGDSSDSKELLFSAKKSGIIQLKTELDVFLASNTKEDTHDFKVKGSFKERSCTIYTKENTIIAQMHKQVGVKNRVLGKDAFSVTVYPQVDFGFIVAVVVILHEINQDRKGED
ncbi:unnamed protein product [Prunus armeniaca]|uniref:Protein LURP-one-related 15 n=1 Tax=Prunus armeniaca TaxID=36596 RepID=A0A6J5XSI1_PRUAR|nr:unnamed protein product [Prunus armeniaca]